MKILVIDATIVWRSGVGYKEPPGVWVARVQRIFARLDVRIADPILPITGWWILVSSVHRG
jgi:hypothetical protein